jgi:hypothetical protein
LLTIYAMVTVRRTTTLPIDADTAFALALKPATFAYIARGILRVPALEHLGPSFAATPDAQASGRMWWLGLLPSWTHHLRVLTIDTTTHTIQTAEHGGPIRTWNHRLTFTPTPGQAVTPGAVPAVGGVAAQGEAVTPGGTPMPGKAAAVGGVVASGDVAAPGGAATRGAVSMSAARGCEYTDEIDIDAGPFTLPTALFARAFFALRQARWRRLAAVLAA